MVVSITLIFAAIYVLLYFVSLFSLISPKSSSSLVIIVILLCGCIISETLSEDGERDTE